MRGCSASVFPFLYPHIGAQISLVQCGGGFSEGIAVFVHNSTSATIPAEERSVAVSPTVPSLYRTIHHLTGPQIWIGGSAGCDILITISMAYLVSRSHTMGTLGSY